MTAAKKDLFFERPEFGEGVFTQIPKGEEIPPELEGKRAHDKPVVSKKKPAKKLVVG